MNDLNETIQNILDICPEKISYSETGLLIANIINLYGLAHLFPLIAAKTHEHLVEHQILDGIDLNKELKVRREALNDADAFMKKVAKGRLH